MKSSLGSNEQFLTVQQVAERYNVSSDTIYRRKKEGTFPKACKVGSSTRWRLFDLLEYEGSLQACFAEKLNY